MNKRILVFSDSHGHTQLLEEALHHALQRGKADMAVFLGDGAEDFEQLCPMLAEHHIEAVQLRGNCDWFSMDIPLNRELRVNGAVIYATHGQQEHVKYGLQDLYYTALERNASAALYGHTHCASIELQGSLLLMNPGSVGDNGSYGELLVSEGGLLTPHLRHTWDEE